MTTPADVIGVAAGELGYVEGPNNANKYGEWYGLNHNPWCDMFVSWVFDQLGAGHIGGRFAYTPSHALWFKQQGRWGTTPQIGAMVFFRFSGPRIHHVGIVTGIGRGYVDTIEGNTDEAGGRTGGKVMRRRRSSGIVGYGYPAYDDAPAPPPPPPPPPVSPPWGFVTVDGDFGRQTIKALQASLNLTGANPRLGVDGDYGPMTRRALQARLNHVAGPVAIDGEVGPQTVRALQRHVGAAVDGDWGPQTTRALQVALNANRF